MVWTQPEPLEDRKASGSFLCFHPSTEQGEKGVWQPQPLVHYSLNTGHLQEDFRDNTWPEFDTLKVSKRVWLMAKRLR